MKIVKAVCPFCGASLNIKNGQKSIKCEYCGGSVFLTDENGQIHESSQEHSTSDKNKHTDKIRDLYQTKVANRYDEFVKKAKKKSPLFPPPGFRSKNLKHMVIAAIGYFYIFKITFGMNTLSLAMCFLLSALSAVDICTDWTGIFRGLKGTHSPDSGFRNLMKAFWSIVICFVWVCIFAFMLPNL